MRRFTAANITGGAHQLSGGGEIAVAAGVVAVPGTSVPRTESTTQIGSAPASRGHPRRPLVSSNNNNNNDNLLWWWWRAPRSAQSARRGDSGRVGEEEKVVVVVVVVVGQQQPRVSWATTAGGTAAPMAEVTVEDDLKQNRACSSHPKGQAREFRLQLTHQTGAAANVEDPAAAAAAVVRRRRKHEDAYDREVRVRKAKLDEEAKAAVEAQRVKLRRDADFLRRQMEERTEAEASERRRMREVDPALDFIAQQRQHAPRDPAADRAAAKYRRDLIVRITVRSSTCGTSSCWTDLRRSKGKKT